jgi:NADH-quinone oxidoreductase subunit L
LNTVVEHIESHFDLQIALASIAFSLPIVTFLMLFFFGKKIPARIREWMATVLIGLSMVISIILCLMVYNQAPHYFKLTWFSLDKGKGEVTFTLSMLVNNLSVLLLVIVNVVSFLVHLYSVEYMKQRRNHSKYFPYLGLFTTAMMGIILSDNLLLTFMFWELVGLSSYLLIGFWIDREEAARAAKKAFLINRIGDLGFMAALLMVYLMFDTFELSSMKMMVDHNMFRAIPEIVITLTGLGLFFACIGKSAQFPLHGWLPDAMEGPTPVSALLHAATMVAAGVYLLVKTNFLLNQEVLNIITIVGAITAVAGALPAIMQHDIKKVLAFSTISQLGYMVMAVGVQAYQAAVFHLVTHAFFKACLFLCAGSVIHSMHMIKHTLSLKGYKLEYDDLDMRLMGGMNQKMPFTFYSYMISALALIGIPFTSGFLSKDSILESVFVWASGLSAAGGSTLFYVIPVLAVAAVFLTAFYMVRQMILVFFGNFRLGAIHPEAREVYFKVKERKHLLNIPLVVLAIFSLWIFFAWNPFAPQDNWLMHSVLPEVDLMPSGAEALWAMITSLIAAVTGIGLAYTVCKFREDKIVDEVIHDRAPSYNAIRNLLYNNWYIDTIYNVFLVRPGLMLAEAAMRFDTLVVDRIINLFGMSVVLLSYVMALIDRYVLDGIVNLSAYVAIRIGDVTRNIQQGRIQGYYLFTLFSTTILLMMLLWYTLK